ncbi:MAG: hypothetical protein WBP58_09560 [Chitinophagaceae bacterium]
METRTIPDIQVKAHTFKDGKLYAGWAPIQLPVWTGYLKVPYRKDDQGQGLNFIGISNSKDTDDRFLCSPEQHAAYFHLLDHQEKIRDAIITKLKQDFTDLLENVYDSYDTEGDSFPSLSSLTADFDFRDYIGPTSVNIEKDVKDGLAYLLWHFHCTWDTEHGFEVVTHGERIIEIAPQADLWKINEDNGSDNSQVSDEMRFAQLRVTKKKWWKFW